MGWDYADTAFALGMILVVCLLGSIFYFGYTSEVSFCNYLAETTEYNVEVLGLECHLEIEEGIWVEPYDKTGLK